MKKIALTLINIAFFFSCFSMENKNYKYVKFEINKNVETLGLIYYLADSSILYNNFAKSSHLLKYYINKFLKFKKPAICRLFI